MPSESIGRVLFTIAVLGAPVQVSAQKPTSINVVSADGERRGSVLSIIPGNALVAVTFQNLKSLDSRVATLTKSFGPPVHAFDLAKIALGIASGIDARGSAAVALLPVVGDGPVGTGLVLILPTSNHDEILAFLDATGMEDGITKVTIRGRASYAASRSGYTVFGSNLKTVQSVVSNARPFVAQCSELQLELIAGHDVSMYVNVAALQRSAVGKRFENWLGARIGFGDLLDSVGSLLVSARIKPGGVSVAVLMEARVWRKPREQAATSETLLRGLPDEPFAIATGGLLGRDDRWESAVIDAVVSAAVGAGIILSDRADDVRAAYRSLVAQSAQVAASLSLLPDGEHDAVGAVKIITTRGAPERLVAAADSLIRVLKSGVFADARYARVVERLEWRSRVESRSGVEIDHIVLRLDGLDAGHAEKAATAFGPEGILVRIGAVDHKYVVVSLGGGVERFDRIVGTLRAGRAPLSSGTAVRMARLGVSQERFWEAYVSVGRCLRVWNRLTAIVGVDGQFTEIPEVNAAVGISVRDVGASETRLDLFVPVEFLVALKNAKRATPAETRVTESVEQDNVGETP